MRFNVINTLAYVLVGAFIYILITRFTDNPSLFINPEGLMVVGGGLLVSAFASFPFTVLKESVMSLFHALGNKVQAPTDEAREVVRLAIIAKRGITRLEPELENIENGFIRSGVELILDGLTPKVFHSVMQKRINEYQERSSRSVVVMLTLSKFAPALGLAATVLGLVQLLSKLGNADMAELGQGMAVALSGTFYGIMVANLFFQPIAELVQMKAESEIKNRELILEGLHSILERQEPLLVGEVVNSFLPDPKRIDFSEELAELSSGSVKDSREAAA